MTAKDTARYTGLAIVIGTHLYMLNNMLPEDLMKQHSLINLTAAGLIIYSLY